MANVPSWQGIEIPPSLQPTDQTKKFIRLQFSLPQVRYLWELHLFASRAPKSLSGSLFIAPQDHRDKRTAPLTESLKVVSERSLRGTRCNSGIDWWRLSVEDGTLLLQAILTDLDSLATQTLKQSFDRQAEGCDDAS